MDSVGADILRVYRALPRALGEEEQAVIVLDGTSLTAGDIARIAAGGADVRLADAARETAARANAQSMAVTRPVYGRTTGVGGNRLVPLDEPTEGFDPALALLRSHASSSGPLRSRERVRGTLAVRLNQLAAGGSGIDPVVLDGLLDMIRADALPPVREYGGVGTGDLPALATAALALLGEISTEPPLRRVVQLGISDALPLLSSNAATIADAAIAVGRLRGLARAALVIAAATFVGASGNGEAFSRAVEEITPFDGAQAVCRTMRRLTAGSPVAARIQDPFALRALPQVHGPLLDGLTDLGDVVMRLANAPSENPAYLPGSDVVHHGGFHVAYLAQSLDSARLALAEAAQLSLARLSLLCGPENTGLPAFLADGRPGASGVMVVEYVVAAALAELRAAATPAALQTVTISNGVEEDASFASLGARQALLAVDAFRSVLAGELVAAIRCLRMKSLSPAPLGGLLAACAGLGASTVDRDLTADLQIAEEVLDAAIGTDGSFDALS
jgi:histidine ammonia-lyase